MASGYGKIDLHMHTVVSDGTDTPQEILANVKAAGIRFFSVTDHDAVQACAVIRALLTQGDPALISGIEFSCRDERGKYHILGYGYQANHEAMKAIVAYGHELRMKKVMARLEFLKSNFGFQFPEEDILALVSLNNPGKPHIAKMMMKYGYAESIGQAIRQFIDQLPIKSDYVRPEEAISAVLAAGGIPVLAHPFYGSGDELIVGEEMENRLCRLIDFGLKGLEAFYSGFSARLRGEALALAEKYRLFTTAGSDYHGRNKLVELGDTGLDSDAPLPDGLQGFLEALGL